MASRSVAVIDDDESVRESLPQFLMAMGYRAEAFASAHAFLDAIGRHEPGCLILDVAMPDMDGPALRQELGRRERFIPVIFITAHVDVALRARLLAEGAVACLFKPFTGADLRAAIDKAFTAS